MKTKLNPINVQKRIDALVKKYNGKQVVIYGAGDYFSFLKENCDLSGLNIVGISDRKFEVSKEENPSNYLPLTPDELKDFDFDVIFVLLKNDEKMCDYLEYQLLMNTKNEDKEIVPFFSTGYKNKAKEHYKHGKRLYNFLLGITGDEDYKRLAPELNEVQNELKSLRFKYLLSPDKKFKKKNKYYKKMTDILLQNIDYFPFLLMT